MTAIQKRFIAGATCPKCQLLDKIVVYQIDGTEYCECVRCFHQQQQAVDPKPMRAQVATREQIIRVIRPVKKTG